MLSRVYKFNTILLPQVILTSIHAVGCRRDAVGEWHGAVGLILVRPPSSGETPSESTTHSPTSSAPHFPRITSICLSSHVYMQSRTMPSQIHIHTDEPTAKRRKVRKGTQSCWECKKRKVRCIWSLPSNDTCDNCTRRKTTCVSQEFPYEPVENGRKSSDGMEERMKRVEGMLERLVNNTGTLHPNDGGVDPVRSYSELRCLNAGETPHLPDILTPSTTSSSFSSLLLSRYTGLSRDILRVWPTQRDLESIYKLPIGLSTHLHMKLCSSFLDLLTQEPTTAEVMLQLPPPGSHPVLFARKLLILGSLLQGAISGSRIPNDQRAHFKTIMSLAVDTASKFVISNDDLTMSVEGVESIMILAMTQNYAGELHRAWLTCRRASAVAQMIGLHRSGSKLRFMDPETRAGLNSEQLCYRIVEMDRYLSITLGLPQSSLESSALSNEALATCHPFDRMARLQVIVAGRILSRSHTLKTPEDMIENDKLLQEAATLMPSKWWLVPHYEASHGDIQEAIHEIARIMYQFSFYHLVIRVHLPYMLRPSTDDNSKATVVHASREILTRYYAFRNWSPGRYYCRGTDFLSFIALMVLCLAHIDARNQSSGGRGSSAALAYSRPNDRAMMERTVGILEAMEDDAIAEKLSKIMQGLLDVEAASANGAEYCASTIQSEDEGTKECDGGFMDKEKDKLQLHIPYFGTIHIQRRLATTSVDGTMLSEHPILTTTMADLAADLTQPLSLEWDNQWLDSSAGLGELDDWTLQSINEGLFSSIFSGIEDQGTTGDINA
jgi:hypothetical protein